MLKLNNTNRGSLLFWMRSSFFKTFCDPSNFSFSSSVSSMYLSRRISRLDNTKVFPGATTDIFSLNSWISTSAFLLFFFKRTLSRRMKCSTCSSQSSSNKGVNSSVKALQSFRKSLMRKFLLNNFYCSECIPCFKCQDCSSQQIESLLQFYFHAEF